MLSNNTNSGRHIARLITQSSCGHVRRCGCPARPGIVFPPWPSLTSLNKQSQLHGGTRSQFLRRQRPDSKPTARLSEGRSHDLHSDEHEEYDEWSTITALESSRRQLDWRQHLKTEQQLDYESDFPSASSKEVKLVDHHGADFELWQELVVHRFRSLDDHGIEALWQRLKAASSTYKTRLWEFPRLWKCLETAACDRLEIFTGVIEHIQEMRMTFKDTPDHFYRQIMLSKLVNDNEHFKEWHQVSEAVWPDKQEIKLLFQGLCEHAGVLDKFRAICFELPYFKEMYSFVISSLLKNGMIYEASRWHSHLIAQSDLPTEPEPVEALLDQLRKKGRVESANKIARDLQRLGLSDGKQWTGRTGHTLTNHKNKSQSSELRKVLEEHYLRRGNNVELSDSFVSRLFATKFFATESILQGLRMINCSSLGPLAFREAIFRTARSHVGREDGSDDPESAHVQELIKTLDAGGIEVEKCVFSKLVLSLAEREEDSMLTELLRDDQHPDSLEDFELQQDLLAHHLDKGNVRAAERALEAIQANDIGRFDNSWTLANMYLQRASDRGDKQAVSRMLNRLLGHQERIQLQALDKAWKTYQPPRRPGKQSNDSSNLAQLTGFLIASMRNNTRMAYEPWVECILGLGQAKRLDELERLCLYLAKWCRDVDFRLELFPANTSNKVNLNSYDNFLKVIFNEKTTQGLVVWGLNKWASVTPIATTASDTASQRAGAVEAEARSETSIEELAAHPSLWGVRLLRKLKDLGVDIQHDEFHRACDVALRRLFGQVPSTKKVTNRMRKIPKAAFVSYAAAMEEIWGRKLFSTHLDGYNNMTRLQDYQKSHEAEEQRRYERWINSEGVRTARDPKIKALRHGWRLRQEGKASKTQNQEENRWAGPWHSTGRATCSF